MRFAVVSKGVVCALMLCSFAFPVLAAQPALTNGAKGEYWGLSEKDVAAKAPGTAAGRQKMAGMVLLDYTTTINNVPVMTGYTLKNEECWKVTIQIEAPDAAANATVTALYEEAVAEITKVLGEPVEKNNPENPIRMISWKGDNTTSMVYARVGNREKAEFSISFESPVLSEKIWGKRK